MLLSFVIYMATYYILDLFMPFAETSQARLVKAWPLGSPSLHGLAWRRRLYQTVPVFSATDRSFPYSRVAIAGGEALDNSNSRGLGTFVRWDLLLIWILRVKSLVWRGDYAWISWGNSQNNAFADVYLRGEVQSCTFYHRLVMPLLLEMLDQVVHRQISMIDESHRKAVVAIEFMPATLEVR